MFDLTKYPRMAAMLERRNKRPASERVVPKPMQYIPQEWLSNNGGVKTVEGSAVEVDESLPF